MSLSCPSRVFSVASIQASEPDLHPGSRNRCRALSIGRNALDRQHQSPEIRASTLLVLRTDPPLYRPTLAEREWEHSPMRFQRTLLIILVSSLLARRRMLQAGDYNAVRSSTCRRQRRVRDRRSSEVTSYEDAFGVPRQVSMGNSWGLNARLGAARLLSFLRDSKFQYEWIERHRRSILTGVQVRSQTSDRKQHHRQSKASTSRSRSYRALHSRRCWASAFWRLEYEPWAPWTSPIHPQPASRRDWVAGGLDIYLTRERSPQC